MAEKKKKTGLKDVLTAQWYEITLMFRTSPAGGAAYWLCYGAAQAIPLVNIWLWKKIIDGMTEIYVTREYGGGIWLFLGFHLGLTVLRNVLWRVLDGLGQWLERRAQHMLDIEVMGKMADVDVAFFDDPKYSDMKDAAQWSQGYITGSMTWFVTSCIDIITFAAGLGMFLAFNPLLGLVFMLTYLPGAYFSYLSRARMDWWSEERITHSRKKNYFKRVLTADFSAKDIRLYDLAGFFKKKYNDMWNLLRGEREKIARKSAVFVVIGSAVSYAGVAAIVLYGVKSVAAETMLLGSLAMFVGLAIENGQKFSRIFSSVYGQIRSDVPRIVQFREFIRMENLLSDGGREILPRLPEIEFKNVWFRYPNSDEYVFKDLSMKIESGEKAAIVGLNGAGKTTLLKLMLRLYDPESGEVLLGGRNIKEYKKSDIFKNFAVSLQFTHKYAMSLRDNIALSDLDRAGDDGAIMRAAAASGADKLFENWEQGLETRMTRQFEETGKELSEGQWQKIGLARAFFSNAGVIMLDEPSSSLDPEAEEHLFSSFRELCRDRGGILISHRLSSIMMVDRIFVLDGGGIIECGTHSELMAAGGKYAELYRLQAGKYNAEVKA